MLKLFRTIRRDLISKKRIGNYLIYALGEIVLVIIGILIALSLNKQREQNKAETKIDVIFNDILNELAVNINETNTLINFYRKKDTIFHLVLNDKLTVNDYTKPKLNGLFSASTLYSKVTLSRYAYDNLVLNMDAVPAKYDTISKALHILNNKVLNVVEDFNDFTKNMVNENIKERSDKYSWYALQINNSENKGLIDYMLNDYRYKNKITNFETFGIFNHLKHTVNYRNKAVAIYNDLAKVLDKPYYHETYKLNDTIINSFSGDWTLIDTPSPLPEDLDTIILNIKFKEGQLLRYFNFDTLAVSKDVLVKDSIFKSKRIVLTTIDSEFPSYQTFILKGDTLVAKTNYESAKFIKTKY